MSVSATTQDLGLTTSLNHLRAVAAAADGPTKRDGALDELRAELRWCDPRLPALIAGVYKNGGVGAEYGLRLTDGREVALGPAAQLLRPQRVQVALLDALGIVIRTPSTKDWGPIVELIHTAAEVRAVELADIDEARGWLARMFCNQGMEVDPAEPEELYSALNSAGGPAIFVFPDGTVNVRPDKLMVDIDRSQNGKHVPSPRELSKRLGSLGFTRKRLERWAPNKPRSANERVRTWLWQSPPGFDLDA